jgi:transcriptional regulator with XRE-family HTH domain
MSRTRKISDREDNNRQLRKTASEKVRSPWGKRIEALLDGRSQTWLAEQCGVSNTNLSDIIRGTMPLTVTGVKIAQALDVTAEFLFTGENSSGANPLMAADQADWVMVPHFRLVDFTESGKPEPIETIPIRKDWLNQTARVASNLWLTDLPSTIDGIGEEGDPILCRDAETHYQEGWYLYFFEGMPIVRKVAGPVFGQLGDVQRPWDYQADDNAGLRLVARILSNVKMKTI